MLALGDLERKSGAIASQVTLLHELSNTIRKASREPQNTTASTSFVIRDEDGNDMEDCLRHYFFKALQDRFPESTDSIRNRLCSTMLLRRKRILYRRVRYSTKPASLPLTASKPVLQLGTILQQNQPDRGGLVGQSREEERLDLSRSTVHSVTKSATTLAFEQFHQASAPSVVSRAQTVDLGAHENLVFPPIPQSQSQATAERTCPFCLFSLPPLDTSTQERWRLVAASTLKLAV